jgi:tetratricopeptide (TPR) repeat protein
MTTQAPSKSFKPAWVIALVLVAAVGVYAYSRVGLLDIPSVPGDIALSATGLDGLPQMKQLDDALHGSVPMQQAVPDLAPPAAAEAVRQGITLVNQDKPQEGLERMRQGILLDPNNLVLTNAYRMTTFRLRREFLDNQRSNPTATFPPYLDREPIAFFDKLVVQHPSRETKLNLALAWVDTMLLFPALEIKAPASVESVKVLSQMIDGSDPYYVPALYALGLNHLHRPARLVWPEADKTPPDAAAQDISRCIAIGRKFGVGSAKLQATLAVSLGDAYVKVGKFSKARSWWQIAQNLSGDKSIQEGVRRRYAWQDEEILDRLEQELDRARAALDTPMTDLRMMWK